MTQPKRKIGYITEFDNDYEKDGQKFTKQSYVIQRGYKDKEGNWQNTSTFFEADLVRLYFDIQKILSEKRNSNE